MCVWGGGGGGTPTLCLGKVFVCAPTLCLEMCFKVYYGCMGYGRDMISDHGHSVSERLSKLKNAANALRVTMMCTLS